MNILIVEDNPFNRQLLRDLIEDIGFDVTEAEDVPSAQAQLETRLPDLILLDIKIPGGGGEFLLTQIRQEKKYQDVPVIAVTSYAMKGDQEHFLTLGFDGYISKPINVVEFPSQIKQYIHRNPTNDKYPKYS